MEIKVQLQMEVKFQLENENKRPYENWTEKSIKKWWIRKIQWENVNKNPTWKKDHLKIVQKNPKLKNGGFKNGNPIRKCKSN